MKTTIKITAMLAIAAALAFHSHAQLGQITNAIVTNIVATNIDVSAPTVVARDANSRVWATVVPAATDELGQVTWRTNAAYTELGAGLHYWNNGAWQESSSAIAITPEGAAATNAAQKAWFPANVNTAGGIRLLTHENVDLRSHIIGLSYATATTNVLIGLLQSSTGLLVSTNQVLYTNAFTGAFKADVRYTFTGPGSIFEQDVLIRTRLPSPTNWGLMGPVSLQIWSEYLSPPQPTVTEKPGTKDQKIAFGGTFYGPGRAFFVGDEQNSTPVRKHWVVNPENGRTCLLEEIDLAAISMQMQSLPPWSGGATNSGAGIGGQAGLYPGFPKQLPPAPKLAQRNGESIKVAMGQYDDTPAFVADYVTLGTAVTNYTFQGDTTYSITSTFGLSGTTTIEGGAVLKFLDQYGSWGLDILGSLVCKTGPYRPAIFTSQDDCTVGETIAHASGTPTTGNYFYCLNLDSSSVNSLNYLRISYAQIGVVIYDSTALEISNCQFVNCAYSIQNTANDAIHLRNILFASPDGVALQFDQAGAVSLSAEQVTADCSEFWGLSNFEPALYLTNSLIIGGFDTLSALYTNQVVINPGGSIFQTFGAANYYLADGSPYRAAGTASVSPAMQSELPFKTTSPPLLLTNNFVVDTTLQPQAQRDSGIPDLGYHYDPIDYFAYCSISNATLTLTNGVALAYYTNHGIWVRDNATWISRGTADHRNYLVHYATVQEQSTNVSGLANPLEYTMAARTFRTNAMNFPNLDLRFLTMAAAAGQTGNLYLDTDNYSVRNLDLRHCEFLCGGSFFWEGDTNTDVVINIQNNILFRPLFVQVFGKGQLSAYNNLIFASTIDTYVFFVSDGAFTWTQRDNAFHSGEVYVAGNVGHNAFLNGATNYGDINNNITNTLTWQSGQLGDFYQSSGGSGPLLNAGSRTAASAGLYHYTVRTDQTKDSSTVDIGYHYVALDGNGKPVDGDSDGVPDYRENPSGGGGTVVSGETDWQSATDLGLKVIITRPKNNTILP